MLLNKGTLPLNQFAEVLQHDMQSTESFTTPENIRRCALLRATHYEWHALRKLGNKGSSMFHDYESALRDIELLPTVEEQEARWMAVLHEEQMRRAAFVRESRLSTTEAASSGGSTSAVATAEVRQHESSVLQMPETSLSPASSSSLTLAAAPAHISKQQSMDWPAYQAAETSSAAGGVVRDSTQHQQQHFSLRQQQQQQQQRYSQQQHHHHHHHHRLLSGDSRNTDMHAVVGKDDDSEMSVNISPEPGNH
ncbi:hypothetical protein LPJ73_007541 [Coemansia sp. RSA 2703]|nr:hypothetical protein LPJ73_007541 [Coemansia sp. RSA 2703]